VLPNHSLQDLLPNHGSQDSSQATGNCHEEKHYPFLFFYIDIFVQEEMYQNVQNSKEPMFLNI
jgi:hypothetical protein